MKTKIIALLITVAMSAVMLAGCGATETTTTAPDTSVSEPTEPTEPAEPAEPQEPADDGGDDADAEPITLRLFSNLPDRQNGQGLIEQMIIDEYMAANPHITIEVEALDDESYKTKFKAYAMDGMPDVVNIWGQPSFLDEVLDAGVLAELNEADYADYGFIPGSMEGFKKDGKLYGLPRNTDIMAFYYNEKMFNDNGWTVPATYAELLELAGTIQDAGFVPVAMDGGEGWPMAIYLTDLVLKLNGDVANTSKEAINNADFSNPVFAEAVQLLIDADDAGLFQTGYDSQDYGTAMSLFTNGQAAMFYMGSWEASMALNQDIPEEVRTNIRAFFMPVVEGGQGQATDIAAWNGGGYGVSASSEVKEEAIKFLNYMYLPEKLSKYGWENGVGMSAQDQSEFMTGTETELQKIFIDIINQATNTSGTPINDNGSSLLKTTIESNIQSVSNGSMSIEAFLATLAEACAP